MVFDSLPAERALEILRGSFVVTPASGGDPAAARREVAEAPGPTVAPLAMVRPDKVIQPGSSDGFDPPADYDALRSAAIQCTRCGLADGRTQVVFSDGHPDASVMVVGEAPGANEDRTGLPFVGRAGKLLDLILASVDLSRERNVYICNVLKCRPPGNRNPLPHEIETCSPWLRRQIELVRPRAILAVGTFSGRLLSGRDVALGKLRGQVYTYQGIPLVVTYHPAALLRNPRWVRPTWDDFQLLRGILERS
ncbi:MAG: uracil-DNA glycosylase [Gemmatimonadales bacterium]|nr:MAG: uracil-DNA glycosylase [Gemmatimonadales bacterium]